VRSVAGTLREGGTRWVYGTCATCQSVNAVRGAKPSEARQRASLGIGELSAHRPEEAGDGAVGDLASVRDSFVDRLAEVEPHEDA
jgi:hypothetical protein